MLPGLTSVTETGTPSSSSSIRRASVNPLTACFEAQYIPWIGIARSETAEPTLMSAPAYRPSLLRKCRAASSEPYTTPQKFVSKRRRWSSVVTSSIRP